MIACVSAIWPYSGENTGLQFSMLERRLTFSHRLQALGSHFPDDYALSFRQHRLDLAPWIDQHAMPPGASAVLMLAALRRGQHIALILDRARAQQDFPMRLAGRVSEGGRHDDQRTFAHGPIQLWKAQVVAYRQPDSAERRLESRDVQARHDGFRFVVRFLAFGK